MFPHHIRAGLEFLPAHTLKTFRELTDIYTASQGPQVEGCLHVRLESRE